MVDNLDIFLFNFIHNNIVLIGFIFKNLALQVILASKTWIPSALSKIDNKFQKPPNSASKTDAYFANQIASFFK